MAIALSPHLKNIVTFHLARPEINDNVDKILGDVAHTRPEISFRANSESRLKPTGTQINDL